MSKNTPVKPVEPRSWLQRNLWLLLRRFSQVSVMTLFLIGPWFGIWWLKGTLSASELFNTVPLTDPFIFAQVIASGIWPSLDLFIGVLIVLGFYLMVGGRVFCSWVCPINVVTDTAAWLRRKLNIRQSRTLSRNTRYWLLGAILVMTFVSGNLIWELVNPVTILSRSIVFGLGSAFYFVVAVFLFDLLVSKNGWCGHLCPMGALYSLIGKASLIKMSAPKRNQCDDCMACYYVCPEPQVLKPSLKGDSVQSLIINASECNNCGRCVDVCPQMVFEFRNRFLTHSDFNIKVEKTA